MKSIKFIIILFVFSSCNQNQSADKKVDFSTNIADTIANIVPEKELPITPRFLELICQIDSLGYLFDTSRCNPDNLTEVNGYLVFEEEVKGTIPFFSKALYEDDTLTGWGDILKDFDLKPLEKAQKVMTYYFKKKEPDIVDGAKWFPDGFIEEWTFDNETDAEKAMQELIDSPLGFIYFNTGAFVCQKENQMYVFYSRAMAFMYEPQKMFFNWFVTQNSIKLFNKQHYS